MKMSISDRVFFGVLMLYFVDFMMILLIIINGLETYKVQTDNQTILSYARCRLHALKRNMHGHFYIKPGVWNLLWSH